MEIKIISEYKLVVVVVSGEIDDHISQKLRTEIDRELMRSGAVNIAFDMSRVSFMDSSGIGVIMGRYKKAASLGGRVIIFGMNPNIARLVEMANLKSIAIIADTLEEAMERRGALR